MHSRMLALVEKPRDGDAEVGFQRPVDVEVGSLRLGGRRDQVRCLNQKVLGHGAKT